jgi:cytochrome c
MDRWEWTRIGAAVAGAAFSAFAISWFTDLVYQPIYPVRSAYSVPDYDAPAVDLAAVQREWPAGVGEPGGFMKLKAYMTDIDKAVIPVSSTSVAATGPAEPPPDLGTLLASADAAHGEQVGKVCGTCHSFDQGGANRVGPNLWAVVGRPIASHAGFAYSDAMKAHGGSWTYEELDAYLTSPARDVPGNKMSFAGIRRAKDRADLLAWLATHGSQSVPKPAPKATPKPEKSDQVAERPNQPAGG